MKTVPIMRLAKNEIFAPSDPTNQATDSMCVKICQEWAKGMREGLHMTPQKERVLNVLGRKSHVARADLAASDTVNDMSERAFALFTHYLKVHGNIGHSSASAMASGKMNAHVVSTTVVTAGKAKGACSKDSSPAQEVLLDTLPAKEVRPSSSTRAGA